MKYIPIILLITITLTYSSISNKRNITWQTDINLWLDINSKNIPRADVLSNLAHAYDTYGYTGKAIDYYKKALSINKDFSRAHNNLGVIYFSEVDKDLGFKHLEIAIKANPMYTEARYNLATAKQALGDHKRAILEYNKLLTITPTHFKTLNNIGLSYHETGQFDMAINYFKKALNIQSDNIRVLINLASTYISKGEMDKAEFILQKIVDRQPLNKEIQMLLNKVTAAPLYYEEKLDILLPQ